MKTLFAFLCTFGTTVGAVSLDFHRLDPAVLFNAVAVAALFACALNDGCRMGRPRYATVARFPGRHLHSVGHRSPAVDLAA